ncbi:MAG: 3-deoxy-8-phosphooctulonate synthase [PVC group bacterium]|nr:3-deoxy-8-phosphooctulonate synthase [PVC group bacterium]
MFINFLSQKDLFLIAGPCVIESEKMCLEHAMVISKLCKQLHIPYIFKASYDKANRTSIDSFRGLGIKKGLSVLKKIRKNLRIPVLSDVHSIEEIKSVAEVVDIIQIPALLCRQTNLILAAAKTKKIINIKKGQFMAPFDMLSVIKKVESTGNKKILLTERGTCFGYNNLVSDMRAIPIMKKTGYPVIFDATHSVQLPGAGRGKSSGKREFVEPLALSAIAAGSNGLFLEAHKTPQKALCDGPNMVDFKLLERILKKAKQIRKIING